MADNKLLQQMLESLINDEQAKAEELFHEYVVSASREIYESLIDSEIAEEAEEDDEEDMEEAAKADSEEDEEDLEENFEEVAGGDDMDLDSEDPTDDLAGELGGEEGEEKGEEELFQDLEAIVDELQAKFDELKGIEGDEHGDEFGGEEGEEGGNPFAKEEGIDDLATVREYVEKVGGATYDKFGKMGDKGENNGLKFSKNDMGGTTANILSGRNGTEAGSVGAGGTIKGSALSDVKPQDNPDAKGNVNVPGGNAGKTGFKKKEPGHGAEKAGAKESPDNKQSLFRGRR